MLFDKPGKVNTEVAGEAAIRVGRYRRKPLRLKANRFSLMFFFIGGITPKTRRIDEQPIRCPNCGLNQAYRTRVDHWLHLFFIPVFPVKWGEPFLFCEHCRQPVDPVMGTAATPSTAGRRRCPSCEKPVEERFRYCPHCGQRLSYEPINPYQ